MPMSEDDDQLVLLRQARDRAAKLIDDLRRKRDALRRQEPTTDLGAESVAAGRQAMDNAVASAERMLAAVEDALRIAKDDSTE